jgi:hypothetical protein
MRSCTLMIWALAVIAVAFADEKIETPNLRGPDVIVAVDAVVASKEADAVVAPNDVVIMPQLGNFLQPEIIQRLPRFTDVSA